MYHSYLVISLNRQNVLKPDPYFLVHLIGKISTPHDLTTVHLIEKRSSTLEVDVNIYLVLNTVIRRKALTN